MDRWEHRAWLLDVCPDAYNHPHCLSVRATMKGMLEEDVARLPLCSVTMTKAQNSLVSLASKKLQR